MEEKIKKIIQAMQGITYLDWQKIKHIIEADFTRKNSAQANKTLIASPDEIIDLYKRLF